MFSLFNLYLFDDIILEYAAIPSLQAILLCFHAHLHHQHSNPRGKLRRIGAHHENRRIRYTYPERCNKYRQKARLAFLRHLMYYPHQNQ